MRVGAAEGLLLPLATRENRHFYAKRVCFADSQPRRRSCNSPRVDVEKERSEEATTDFPWISRPSCPNYFLSRSRPASRDSDRTDALRRQIEYKKLIESDLFPSRRDSEVRSSLCLPTRSFPRRMHILLYLARCPRENRLRIRIEFRPDSSCRRIEGRVSISRCRWSVARLLLRRLGGRASVSSVRLRSFDRCGLSSNRFDDVIRS